jgi:ABC-type spermidine/putrescine transport system permease subunit I
MAAIPVESAHVSPPGVRQALWPVGRLVPAVLLAPSLLFLAVFFALPALTLVLYSVMTQAPDGTIGLPLTLAHYQHFFTTSVYSRVLLTTLRISLWTTAAAALLAYPVALVMVRSPPVLRQAITMIVIAPLIVSVVVRTYGWQLILGNGPNGILNCLLLSIGLAKKPVALLYSEAAVVIGSLHVFFPMMVLPVASALGRIDPRLEDAARTLGATAWRASTSTASTTANTSWARRRTRLATRGFMSTAKSSREYAPMSAGIPMSPGCTSRGSICIRRRIPGSARKRTWVSIGAMYNLTMDPFEKYDMYLSQRGKDRRRALPALARRFRSDTR